MTIPTTVLELVERFERNLDVYKRVDYKEARVRIEFIDPFFEALGWDVRNVQGRGEHDKDVIYEDAIKVGGKTRAPDYSFRVGQERRFFLEAKKPAISLIGDVGPAYQLRRYHLRRQTTLSELNRGHRPGDKRAGVRVVWVDRSRDQNRRGEPVK